MSDLEKIEIEVDKSFANEKALGKLEEELQEELQSVIKSRNNERFLWVILIFIILDAFIFLGYSGWGSSIGMIAIEFLFLYTIARFLKIEVFTELIAQVGKHFGKN